MCAYDRRKTLDELEGVEWRAPNFHSGLVEECHRLRRVPLSDFTPENLRIMIGQHIGEDHLIPIALELIRVDPLAEGDYYPGDLLAAVLNARSVFWKNHPDLRDETQRIVKRSASLFQGTELLQEACERFEKSV